MTTTGHVMVLTTAPSEEEGRRLARELVDARLAACVQMTSPIRAVYRWKGTVHDEPEWQLWIKTTAGKVDELVAWIPGHHRFEVPEVIVVPITGGWTPYLDWITAETGDVAGDRPAATSPAPPYRCQARVEIDESWIRWLHERPGAAHQVEQHSYCAIEGGHPGPHAALGQQAGETEWWIRWTLSASEIVQCERCPAETVERHRFDPTEPADFCLLYAAHPGRHSYEWGDPAPW